MEVKGGRKQATTSYNKLQELRAICVNLKMQRDMMIANCAAMFGFFGMEHENSIELLGAAKMTQGWIDNIESQEGVLGKFKKTGDSEQAKKKIHELSEQVECGI